MNFEGADALFHGWGKAAIVQKKKKSIFYIIISPPISKWSSIPPIPLRCFACSHNEQRQAVVVVVFFFYFIIFCLFFFYQSHVTGDVISHKTSTKTEPSLSHLTFFRTKKSQFNTDTLSSTWVPCWVTHLLLSVINRNKWLPSWEVPTCKWSASFFSL